MSTALIVGASRGIGRELARQYLSARWRVVATARSDQDCAALASLGAEAIRLDVTHVDDLAGFGWRVNDERLDAVFLCAGVFGPRHDGFPTELEFDTVMHTNVLSAMRLLPIVAPLAASVRGKVAVLSSRMGSIGARSSSSGSLYRASKAALNSVLADAALIYGPQGATCVSFHPGWVQTEMGGASADISVEHSAAGMRATLDRLTTSDNGRFLNYDGTPLPW